MDIDGEHGVFYSLWIVPGVLKFDHIVHAYGFGAATWVSWEALCSMLKLSFPSVGALTAAALIGMGLGAVNEVIEFFAVLLIPDTNVGDYMNTGWDLVSNGTGTVLAALLIRLSCTKNKIRHLSRSHVG